MEEEYVFDLWNKEKGQFEVRKRWPKGNQKTALSFFNFMAGRSFDCRLWYDGRVLQSYSVGKGIKIFPEKKPEVEIGNAHRGRKLATRPGKQVSLFSAPMKKRH